MESIGARRWVIAERYIPEDSASRDRRFTSHESACLLNAGDLDARVVEIVIYFSDCEPVGPYRVTTGRAARCICASTTLTTRGAYRATPTSRALFTSSVPIVVQHTRLDSRRTDVALLSTLAFAG